MSRLLSRNLISVFPKIGTRFKRSIGSRMAFLCVPLVFGLSPTIFAFPVTYTFTGHLTNVDAGPPFLSIDDQFSGSFTIDSATPRSPVPDYATWALYNSRSAVVLSIGSRTWSRNAMGSERCIFTVQNGERDEIDFVCGADRGPTRLHWWWRFVDSTGNAFVNNEIPLGPFAPDAFNGGFAFMNFYWRIL